MGTVDIAIIIIWLIFILAVGMLAGLRAGIEGFWINRRLTSTPYLVFTIVATQVGGGATVGIVASSYADGIGFGLVALVSTCSGFLALAFFAPKIKRFGDRMRAITLSEALGVRYGRPAQFASSVVILFSYFSLLAGQFLAVGILFHIWTGLSLNIALGIAAAGVIAYSAFAGLRGDIITDVIHFWIMLIVFFFLLLPFLIVKEPIAHILSSVPTEKWSPVAFAGYSYVVIGILLGALVPVVGMEMWMRIYAAGNVRTARNAYIWSAGLVIPFYAFAMFAGLLATQLFPGESNPDVILAKLLFDYLPRGLLGIGIAGLLAVFISTANTLIVVLGATVYRDILKKGTKHSSDSLSASRLITLSIGVVGLLLSILIPDLVQLMLNAFFVIAVLFPSLIGIAYWKRATLAGATSSIIGGGLVTLGFLPVIPRQAFLPGLVVTVLSFVVVSLCTSHAECEHLDLDM